MGNEERLLHEQFQGRSSTIVCDADSKYFHPHNITTDGSTDMGQSSKAFLPRQKTATINVQRLISVLETKRLLFLPGWYNNR
jgi:hypothetical protein